MFYFSFFILLVGRPKLPDRGITNVILDIIPNIRHFANRIAPRWVTEFRTTIQAPIKHFLFC
jgi:hypothetical protein